MGLGSEMKNLSEELLASFKNRINANEELVSEVQQTLDGFRKDQQEMADVLKANAAAVRKDLAQSQKDLAAGEKERLVVSKDLMVNINGTISSIQKEVVSIQSSTFDLIKSFSTDRTTMADELSKFFEQGRNDRSDAEKNRMKEFDDLMTSINNDINNINIEVAAISKYTNDMLARFEKEHADMSAEQKAELNRNLAERVEYTASILKGFRERLTEIGKETLQMAKAMRKDLSDNTKKIEKDEAQRAVDYKDLMKGIQATIAGINKEVNLLKKSTSNMLNDLTKDRGLGVAEWTKMQDLMAQIRNSGHVATPKLKEKVAEKPIVKVADKPIAKVIDKPIAKVIEKPVEKVVEKKAAKKKVSPEAKPKAQPEPEMSLEDKIVDYINKNPKGVKVSDMEVPMGEARMKIGYIAKKLLDDGKILKVDNQYFPKP